jgi:hypothetical protein
MGRKSVRRPLSDAELDALLARVRTDTAREVPPRAPELIRAAAFEVRAHPVVRGLSVVSVGALAFFAATVVAPAVAGALVTLWWLVPVVGFAWTVLRAQGSS